MAFETGSNLKWPRTSDAIGRGIRAALQPGAQLYVSLGGQTVADLAWGEARAGVPMLPVVAGPDATRLQILLYTIVLVAVAFAPWPLGYFDAGYGIVSLILGAGMLALAVNVYRHRTGSQALRATRKLFAFSILYLFALFATLLLEVVVHALAPSIW